MEDTMKVLIFDMDDTLVVEKASAEAAFLETCEVARARYGIDARALHATVRETCRALWHRSPTHAYCRKVGISSWEGLWARFKGDDNNLRVLREWAPRYRRNSWYQALTKHGVDDAKFALELAEAFPGNRRKLHIVYDDVRPTLERLGKSYQLALLSNGAPDLQREKIEGARVGQYFEQIVISGEVGIGKPDARIYHLVLSRFDVTAGEAMMIGDSLRSDVQGAQAVGMKAVWLNRSGRTRDDTVVPDVEVSDLYQLKEAL